MNRKGFTLIEVLAVIVILALILTLALPKILQSITKGREGVFEDDLKSVYKSMETHIQSYDLGMADTILQDSVNFARDCDATFWDTGKQYACKYTYNASTGLSSLMVRVLNGPGKYATSATFNGVTITIP